MLGTLALETFLKHDCKVELRRIVGPVATELFILCEPLPAAHRAGADAQSEGVYRALVDVLESAGGSFSSVVSESLYLERAQADLEAVRSGRRRVLSERAAGCPAHVPVHGDDAATLLIGQPPLTSGARLEVAVQAVIPLEGELEKERFSASTRCLCAECAPAQGLSVRFGSLDETCFYAAGLCGAGDDAYAQTIAMFEVAEDLLRRAGMEFSDVVRTWIHLRDIDRDYDDLNRARRAFFDSRGISPVPASTGIGGAPASAAHDLCLGLYALKGQSPTPRTVMNSPTLNEAGSYGADFVRGMRSVETNKVALHISGTASIDEAGRTAHVGNFDAQADRMLVNVAALLEGQGAGFGDVVSAVTYVKHAEDAPRLREKFQDAGYAGFPNAFLHAPVCRPELLCETEALAVLPKLVDAPEEVAR